jgi:hypothetical protein
MSQVTSIPRDISADIDRAAFAISQVLKSGLSQEDRRLLSLALASLRSIDGAVKQRGLQ